MIDSEFTVVKTKKIEDLNVVPILDMLVSVIFFLLLSTSFVGFTKLQVPPSAVSTITSPVLPPPVAAKLLTTKSANGYKISLNWAGASPDQRSAFVSLQQLAQDEKFLLEKVKALAVEFAGLFPNEKTIQLGLGGSVPYQILIDVMDGVREQTPDIVLISYDEAEALNTRAGG